MNIRNKNEDPSVGTLLANSLTNSIVRWDRVGDRGVQKMLLGKVRKSCRKPASIIGVTILLSLPAAVAAEPSFIAGVDPSQRPAGAPAISVFHKPSGWAAAAERGITDPKPASVKAFLADQGAWYTPFTHPGMLGRYDIRGLHAKGGHWSGRAGARCG